LLGQIVTLMEAITTTGGAYRTDLGDTVVRELTQVDTTDPDAEPPPRIVVALADRITLDLATTQRRTRAFQVACEATFWGDDINGQEQALAALEDMLDVIPRRTQLVQSATVSSDVKIAAANILNRPEGLPVTAAVLVLDVVMQEVLSP
jgi:hypothetical protein